MNLHTSSTRALGAHTARTLVMSALAAACLLAALPAGAAATEADVATHYQNAISSPARTDDDRKDERRQPVQP